MSNIDGDDIMRIAQESGATVSSFYGRFVMYRGDIERFFAAAYEAGAEAEREACARVCEAEYEGYDWAEREKDGAEACAAAIRARGEK